MSATTGVAAIIRPSLRPNQMLRYFIVAAALAAIMIIWFALRTPMADVSFRNSIESSETIVRTDAERLTILPDAVVRLRGVDGRAFEVRADRLASREGDLEPDRLRLAALLRQGAVDASVTDWSGVNHRFRIGLRETGLADLNAQFWLSLLCGLSALLFGLGVWAVRPESWAARCIALIGLGLFCSTSTHGLSELWTVAIDTRTVDQVSIVNFIGLHSFGWMFLALFARFPLPLVPKQPLIAFVALAMVASFVLMIRLGPSNPALNAWLMLCEYFSLFAFVAAQTWRGWSDRGSRRVLVILIVTIGLGMTLYLLVAVLPILLGAPHPMSESTTLPLFVLIYCGIGVSTVRAGLFAFDRWTRSIMVSICLGVVVLTLDILLASWLSQQRDVALGVALAMVSLVYFPGREWLLRRAERRREEQGRRSLRLATDLAFAPNDAARAERWRAAIAATFDPLEIVPDTVPHRAPMIGEDGNVLHLPAIAGVPALLCRHPSAGQRLFVPGDVEAAEALLAIVARLVEARDAYTQGASQERKRIARDLHDDVSGRLMTSLHRQDATAIQQDVREAMADIRVIVNGLMAEPRGLGEVLADIRHEAKLRLEAAHVALAWSMGPEFADVRPIAYPVYRHVVSVVRESVSNIVRHAGASGAEIAVSLNASALVIEIADDGTGMGPLMKLGNGLSNCARRAESLGGDFEILPQASGSAVRFRIDLAAGLAASEAAA